MADETKRDDAASRELAGIDGQIAEVEKKISKVEQESDLVKKALSEPESGGYLGITQRPELLKRLEALEEEKKQLRQKEHDLREEKKQLREKELRLMPMPQPAPSGPERFVVRGKIRGALNTMGVRAYMYGKAMEHLAYYRREDRSEAIWYEGADLHICLAFMSVEQALHFQNALTSINTGLVSSLHGKVDIEDSISTESLAVAQRVMTRHYDGGASDFPGNTLADMIDRGTEVSASVADAETALAKYQSVEKPELVAGYGFEKCHIKDKSVCRTEGDFVAAGSDDSNLLALSPTVHKLFYGRQNGCASIAFRPGAEGEEIAVEGRKRRNVELLVECWDVQVALAMQTYLKPGTEKVDATTFKTWVHVESPERFRTFVECKCNKTTASWQVRLCYAITFKYECNSSDTAIGIGVCTP